MEDQICSPEKYSMKNSYNKYIFYKMKMLLIEYKFILSE